VAAGSGATSSSGASCDPDGRAHPRFLSATAAVQAHGVVSVAQVLEAQLKVAVADHLVGLYDFGVVRVKGALRVPLAPTATRHSTARSCTGLGHRDPLGGCRAWSTARGDRAEPTVAGRGPASPAPRAVAGPTDPSPALLGPEAAVPPRRPVFWDLGSSTALCGQHPCDCRLIRLVLLRGDPQWLRVRQTAPASTSTGGCGPGSRSSQMPGWRRAPLAPHAWRAPADLTSAQRTAKQDHAAGGRERRQFARPDGRIVTASIALKHLPGKRRIYAYLRWSAGPRRSQERYVAEVTEPGREANLRGVRRRPRRTRRRSACRVCTRTSCPRHDQLGDHRSQRPDVPREGMTVTITRTARLPPGRGARTSPASPGRRACRTSCR
jgi:hypothetical protein